MLVLQRRSSPTGSTPTKYVNLWKLPRNSLEALGLTRAIQRGTPADLSKASGTCELGSDGSKFGEMVAVDLRSEPELPWSLPTAFAQTDLCRAAFRLRSGSIFTPGKGIAGTIRMVGLGDVIELGPDGRDVYDGYGLSPSTTPYAALWGYDASSMNSVMLTPNKYLSPLTAPLPRRPLRDANLLWSRAGRLMLPKELWMGTCALAAAYLPSPALSNVWWPARWKHSESEESASEREKEVALWFNSTIGLFSLLMRRQETRGPWIKFPKAWYEDLPIPDFGSLVPAQRKALRSVWTRIATKSLLPYPKMDADPARAEIDAAFATVFNVQSFDTLRNLLSHEPIVAE